MFCPQCGAQLGEGARGCAACGWTSSRRTLWIVLGSIFGVLALACCGGLLFIGNKFKKAAEEVQAKATPAILSYHRLAVLNYAKKRGSLPESLVQAAEEPLEVEDHAAGGAPAPGEADPAPAGDPGEEEDAGGAATVTTSHKTTIKFDMQKNGQHLDAWENPLRYTVGENGGYEIRSPGPDGAFDTADDVSLSGNTSDDLAQVTEEFRKEAESIGREFFKALGLDPNRVKTRRITPVEAPPGPGEPPPGPGEPPPGPGEEPPPAPGGGK